MKPSIIFFGSFLQYSVQILEKLHKSGIVEILGVVTTPPMPAGRKQELQKTHIHQYADETNLPLFTPETLDLNSLSELSVLAPDLFVVAGYGKLLPSSWLTFPKIASLNVHFSLLPKFRGANPGEWAILMGESETGVTFIEMSEKFDTGNIISQAKTEIVQEETRETLYQKLYEAGADLALESLPIYFEWKTKNLLPGVQDPRSKIDDLYIPPIIQVKSDFYARRLTKEEAFIPWTIVAKGINGAKIEPDTHITPLLDEVINYIKKTDSLLTTHYSLLTDSAIRALTGFPGVWTEVETTKGKKRLKIHSAHIDNSKLVLDLVQLEGQIPTNFNQLKNQILISDL